MFLAQLSKMLIHLIPEVLLGTQCAKYSLVKHSKELNTEKKTQRIRFDGNIKKITCEANYCQEKSHYERGKSVLQENFSMCKSLFSFQFSFL